MVFVENDVAYLAVDEKGSEICSFKDKETNLERMWNGDPKFWAGRNPTLFPMVSNTYNKVQVFDGKEYHMGNHGIVRSAMFKCTYHDDKSIKMTFESSEESKQLYPFDFRMDITYTLTGKRVDIVYNITNLSDKVMPFGFGLHPAFNCPIADGEKFEDYYIEFANEETLECINGPFKLNNEKIIHFDYMTILYNKTIIFEYAISTFFSLTNGKHGVKVGVVGYRWLAFWTKMDAPYICIEPWHSHGDFTKVDVPFEQREGTTLLDPDHSYTTSYYIELV